METITIIRPATTTNAYGDTALDWGTTTTTDVKAIVYPRSTTPNENNANRTAVIVGLTALLPDGADVQSTDRITARGETWEALGEPGDWRSPWGWKPGLQIDLERVEG